MVFKKHSVFKTTCICPLIKADSNVIRLIHCVGKLITILKNDFFNGLKVAERSLDIKEQHIILQGRLMMTNGIKAKYVYILFISI